MFGLWNKHDILELPQIPREKVALRQIVGKARREMKKSRLIKWAALNIAAWGVFILFFM